MTYHSQDVQEVLRDKQSSTNGLSDVEARRRLLEYGENKLKLERRDPPWKIFFRQFGETVVYILLFATIVSFLLGEYLDAYVILAILFFNALLGFFQEYKAERAVQLLQQLTVLKAKVLRDGVVKEIPSTELIPGDVVLVEAGDKVPADIRIFDANNLQTNEAALTGESLPCSKFVKTLPRLVNLAERVNMLYSSTIVVRGTGRGIVVETGMKTELGKIAKMVQEAGTHITPLQKKLKQLGRFLGFLVMGICAFVFLFGLLRGMDFFETLLTAISLAVAAVPEGLPAVVTICLSLSVQYMIKRKVLVKRLKSIETLGSVTVICSDKTGTLTKNEMTVKKIYVNNQLIDVGGYGYSTEGTFTVQGKEVEAKDFKLLLNIAASCNNATDTVGDPTEMALLYAAKKGGIHEKLERTGEIPFEAEKKYMATLHKGFTFYKGAPEIILHMCTSIIIDGKKRRLIDRDKAKILSTNELLAQSALRVLGMAIKQDEDIYFVGLMGMIDPPKEGVREAMALCKQAGIRAVMITGDHPLTAEAIGKQIGFEGQVMSGAELEAATEADMQELVKKYTMFARASSSHKVKILKALQANGEIVAMTGDGLNDAPALKNADIGVAMSLKGTDVSRDAADMILTDDNFSSIVSAVEQGRVVYDNIKKFVNYLLSANAVEVGVIVGALLIGMPLPLLPLQILWLNLMTDSWPALALAVDAPSGDVMQRKPRSPKEHIITGLKQNIVYTAIIGTLLVLGVFIIEYEAGQDLAEVRSIALTTLILFEILRAYNCKSSKPFTNLFSNKWLHLAALVSIGMHIALLYTPMGVAFKVVPLTFFDWMQSIGMALGCFVVLEFSKLFIKSDYKA
ncbi:MAG: cation-translocating P-type ATPase [Candidatus Woesearchaeota archaeon]|nr:cation-translocating P-type ATPase [Candidatus Woesearchaeota archaeon]